MTEAERTRLLVVSTERPLNDALTVRRGARKGEMYAEVRSEVRERLKWLGREWALIFKTLVLTGLRKGELASLIVVLVTLHGNNPFLSLNASDEKNREGNDLPIRDDLAADLRLWLADKLANLRAADQLMIGEVFPLQLPPDTPLFNVPAGLMGITDRDLVAAGIAKLVTVNGKVKIDNRDERGRTIDVHALRITFGTLPHVWPSHSGFRKKRGYFLD